MPFGGSAAELFARIAECVVCGRANQIPGPGKISIAPTRQMLNQRDLALAHTPGVAAPCEEIVADPANSYKYTACGNLVAVITNGTAVLGLGNIGPLAAFGRP